MFSKQNTDTQQTSTPSAAIRGLCMYPGCTSSSGHATDDASIIYSILTQHDRTIFFSSRNLTELKISGHSPLFTTPDSTQRVAFLQTLVKFQRRKNPAKYRYAILGKMLGSGNQGAVYSVIGTVKIENSQIVIKPKTTRIVKIMQPEILHLNSTLSRLSAENECLMMQRAPEIYNPRNVIFDRETNRYALVSRLFPGEDLIDFLNKHSTNKNFTLKKRIHLALLLLIALKKIHEKGIIHRDIKLENFIAETDGNDNPINANIIDLGYARETGMSTDGGDTPGTEKFVAPESWKREYSSKPADIFALGRVFWYLFGNINAIENFFSGPNARSRAQAAALPSQTVLFSALNYDISPNACNDLYKLFIHINGIDPRTRATIDEYMSTLKKIAYDHIPDVAIQVINNKINATATPMLPSIAIKPYESDESEQPAAVASSSYNPRLYGPSVSTATATAAAAAAATTAAATTAVSLTIPTCPRK